MHCLHCFYQGELILVLEDKRQKTLTLDWRAFDPVKYECVYSLIYAGAFNKSKHRHLIIWRKGHGEISLVYRDSSQSNQLEGCIL